MAGKTYTPTSAINSGFDKLAAQSLLEHDQQVFQTLLLQHPSLNRHSEKLGNGVSSQYDSNNHDIASLLQTQPPMLCRRVNDDHCSVTLLSLYDQLDEFENPVSARIDVTEAGVVVTETAKEERVVELLHALSDAIDELKSN